MTSRDGLSQPFGRFEMKFSEKRKMSVAPWSDDRLMKFAESIVNTQNKKNSQLSKHKSADSFQKSSESLRSLVYDRYSGIFALGSFLISKIFKLLDFRTQIKIRRVNKAFKSILNAEDNHLFENINLEPWHKTINDANFEGILSGTCLRIRHLNVKNCWGITDVGLNHITRHAEELHSLNLFSLWDITDEGLFIIAPYCDFLKFLNLSNCRKITSKGLSQILKYAHSLDYLNVSHCKSLGDDVMECSRWITIKKLNLQRCTAITDRGFKKWEELANLFEKLNSMTSTSKIQIPEIEITPSNPSAHSVDEDNKSISGYLNVPRNSEHRSITYFALEELSLADCSFLTDETIITITKTCPKLKKLYLSFCCSLTEAFASFLIKGCPYITNLDTSFCGNAITNSSLLEISAGLSCLESLSIRGCVQVGEEGLQHLSKYAKSLKYINYSQCKIKIKDESLIGRWMILDQRHFEFENENKYD